MEHLNLLYPEFALGSLALGLLVSDLFVAPKHGRLLYHLAWIISIVTLCLIGFTISDGAHFQGVGTLWAVDPFSQFFKMLILLTTVLSLLMGLEYRELPSKHAGIFTSLLLMASAGMMFLVSSTDLLLTFIALELISISSFILTGFERRNPKSNEGALKYFLFGAFSSAIMAYGISLFYGATGSTRLLNVTQAPGPLMILGLLFILLGLGFKASIAPMHFWVPDAYEGAPTPVTAYLSVAPKIATIAALMRIFTLMLPASMLDLTSLFTLLAALTMTIGNFTAMFQTNVKRLLAYSSVAQAGYMLIGLVAAGTSGGDVRGIEGVLLYSFIYVAMNIGAFVVVQAVATEAAAAGAKDPYGLEAFNGLARRSFGLALALTFCLLSLAGIPPLAGFIGKLYIFESAVKTGHIGLAVVGLVNSVVSVYFYMRIAYHMFFKQADSAEPIALGPYLYGGLAVAIAGVIIFGIYPEPLIASVQSSAGFLP